MPRSPTSSEDEMAQSFSDYSQDSGSECSKEDEDACKEDAENSREDIESSREEALYETIGMERLMEGQNSTVMINILIPDLQQTKCMSFEACSTVWAAKQLVLCGLSQNLKDVLNYGLFQNSQEKEYEEDGEEYDGDDVGEFLDEERMMGEFSAPDGKCVATLEFRYKTRLYNPSGLDQKLIARINTQPNMRRFIDHIQNHQLEKLSRMLDKGLDPNFQDPETGETPLTHVVQLENVVESITILRNGGAHLDFRAKDGMTPMHKAAHAKNQQAIEVLLDLGASPNSKDSRGLTALYHTVTTGGDTYCCQLLLSRNAALCCQDENGWQETHQACRHGHVEHLEYLLGYGADMSAQNASGNTPLHICALYNQEQCAAVLLLRGAEKDLRNHSSQSPF
ncbi:hypothetical protein DNTS_000439, partial [Danionella cerebrum]